MTQDRPTNPVNHARADAARARGRARTVTQSSTMERPTQETKLRLRARQKASFFRMKPGRVAPAVLLAAIILWAAFTLASLRAQSREALCSRSVALDPTVTLTGSVKVG